MTEEERAALFREQRIARRQHRCGLLAALSGDPDAAAEVRANWQPLLDHQLDRQVYIDPELEDEMVGPCP